MTETNELQTLEAFVNRGMEAQKAVNLQIQQFYAEQGIEGMTLRKHLKHAAKVAEWQKAVAREAELQKELNQAKGRKKILEREAREVLMEPDDPQQDLFPLQIAPPPSNGGLPIALPVLESEPAAAQPESKDVNDISTLPPRTEGQKWTARVLLSESGALAPEDLQLTAELVEESRQNLIASRTHDEPAPFRAVLNSPPLMISSGEAGQEPPEPHVCIALRNFTRGSDFLTSAILRPLIPIEKWDKPQYLRFDEIPGSHKIAPEDVDLAGLHVSRDEETWIIGSGDSEILLEWKRPAVVQRKAAIDAGGHEPAEVAEANMAGGYAVGSSTLAHAMEKGPNDSPGAGWRLGGPLQQWIPEMKADSGQKQSWFQWAMNLHSSITTLAKKEDVELPAQFDIFPNLYWARMYHAGKKSREAAEAFVNGVALDREHNNLDDTRERTIKDLLARDIDPKLMIDDPGVNDHGVYVQQVENVRIHSKGSDHVIVRVIKSNVDGLWRFGHDRHIHQGGSSSPVSVTDTGYTSRAYAIRTAAHIELNGLKKNLKRATGTEKPKIAAAVKSIENFLANNPCCQIPGGNHMVDSGNELTGTPAAEQIHNMTCKPTSKKKAPKKKGK
jgi:hypothetical protein